MIEFIVLGKKYQINENFQLSGEGELTSVLKFDLEAFLVGFRPQDGDPFLAYADRLAGLGAEITKSEPIKDSKDKVF